MLRRWANGADSHGWSRCSSSCGWGQQTRQLSSCTLAETRPCWGPGLVGCDGVCNSGQLFDCLGVCGGANQLDDCGVCAGQNKAKDCAGVCFGNTPTGAWLPTRAATGIDTPDAPSPLLMTPPCFPLSLQTAWVAAAAPPWWTRAAYATGRRASVTARGVASEARNWTVTACAAARACRTTAACATAPTGIRAATASASRRGSWTVGACAEDEPVRAASSHRIAPRLTRPSSLLSG